MAGTEIANAYVALQVKMPGVKNDISKALGGSGVQSAVAGQGRTMGNVLTGAIAGAAAAATSKAISMVTGSINSAIARVDTMNNFPKIMANLGFSAGDAKKSIDQMSKSLTGLPTSLDSMAGMVQQLAPLTGGLGEATDLSLALNNALLAGGKSTEVQANAMEQYVQQLAIGKVDMTAWRSMVSAMPGQMDQLSKSLLGAGAGQTDLYNAMQNGTVTFDQFNAAILSLNDKGASGFASFEEQARSATEGIATGQANLNTAIVRGMANLIQKFKPMIDAFIAGMTAFASGFFESVIGMADWVAENKDWLAPLAIGLGVLAGGFMAINTASTIAAAGGLLKFIAASKAGAAAQLAFNLVMNANPIMLIVTAIGALVAGLVYFFTQTELGKEIWANFTQFLGEAWANISQFFTDAWENVIQPVFQAIGDIATWLWENVLSPVFTAIGGVVQWLAAGFKLQFDLIVNAFRLIGAIANWLWVNVLSPVFTAIANVVAWVWNTFISPIFTAIGGAIKILGDAFSWLWVNVIKPVWDGISATISTVWNWIDKNVFTPFKTGIGLIGTAFENIAKTIGTAWDGIKKAAAVPINFVLDTVWNKGLRSFWNDMVGTLGLDDMKLPKAKLVKFADGGVMPGYTPGRDVHQFTSPTGGRLALSGGEAIMRPEFTKAVGGAAGVARLNSMARNGQAFADGGVFGELGNFAGDVWDNIKGAAAVAWDFISDPGGAIQKHVIDGIINPLLGGAGDGIFGKTVGAFPGMLMKNMTGLLESAAPKGVGTAGMGWQAMWQIIQNAAPGLRKTSDYRPGAMTVNGGKSYHGSGRAVDLVPASMSTFNQIAKLFPNASELIYSPAGNRQLKNGQPFNGWSDAVRRQHYNHVHLAMANGGVVPKLYDQGGWLPSGGMAVNKSGKPEAVLTSKQSEALVNGLGAGSQLRLVVDGYEFNAYVESKADARISHYDSAEASMTRGRLR